MVEGWCGLVLLLKLLLIQHFSLSGIHLALRKEDDFRMECFLTHSLKEELEEMKESLVLSVRPEQMMP